MFDQYHLTGPRHSGRAVRVRQLDDSEVSDCLTDAARQLGPTGLYGELKMIEWKMGIKRMVVAVSDPCEDPFKDGVKWRKVSHPDFDENGLATFFTSKDVKFLQRLYQDYHEVNDSEIDVIMGKGKAVSEA